MKMSVTDVQVHLWEPEHPDRPWPKPQQRLPHRPNGFSAEEMLEEMDAVGVDRAVIVPPTWAGDSNVWALDVATRYPNRFAVVGRFDVKAPGRDTATIRVPKTPNATVHPIRSTTNMVLSLIIGL
jgi:L-fuconolactonase